MRKYGISCTLCVSVLAWAAPADVGMTYQSFDDTAGRLTVLITNTTLLNMGGFVTGFAFNLPTLNGVNITSIGGDIEDAGPQQTTQLSTSSVNPGDFGWWTRFDYEGIKAPN